MSSLAGNLAGAGLIFSFLFLSPLFVEASESLSIIINEIAWMGTKTSYNDEWIELYNNTASQINLAGWKLIAHDDIPAINLAGGISANGYFLLERTSDDTIPETPADQIYSGALANNGENLGLYDVSGNLIDSVNCSSGWFAGNNSTKQTMERNNPLLAATTENWATSQSPGGTPKAINSFAGISPAEDRPPSTSTEDRPPDYPADIFINEILPSPEGPDETDEWIEIFNQNNFSVDLSEWKIKDSTGKSVVHIIQAGTKILSQGFFVLTRPTSKITLNNDGDEVSLIRPDGKIMETISYSKAPTGQSYNRVDSEWFWSPQLTPGAENIMSEPVSKAKKSKPSDNIVKENESSHPKKESAAIGEKITEGNPFVFLTALVIAIFSGVIILILKRNLKIS